MAELEARISPQERVFGGEVKLKDMWEGFDFDTWQHFQGRPESCGGALGEHRARADREVSPPFQRHSGNEIQHSMGA